MVQIANKLEERDPLVRIAKLGSSSNKSTDASSASKKYFYMLAFLVLIIGTIMSKTSKQQSTAISSTNRAIDKTTTDSLLPASEDDETDDIGQSTVQQQDNQAAESSGDDGGGGGEAEISDNDAGEADTTTDDDENDDETIDNEDDGADEEIDETPADETASEKDETPIENIVSENDEIPAEETTGETVDDAASETEESPPAAMPSSLPGPAEDWAWIIEHEIIPPLRVTDFSLPKLLEQFQQARQNMYEQMERDYGAETFKAMFLREGDVSVGRTALESPHHLSRARITRKMVMKILQVQTQMQAVEQNNQRMLRVGGRDLQTEDDAQPLMIPFVWATSGHSSAAGHGNYYNESYTAQLERMGVQVFEAVGLHLVGRNFAMGGTLSGMEVGSCVDQIYGFDIDVLSWDFGMTDGRALGIFENFFSHAAMHLNRPAMVALNANGRFDLVGQLEENGLPIMYMSEPEVKKVFEAVPDTLGRTQEQIDEMPLIVRNFKCDNKIEVGDPGCADLKFTPDHCPDRKFRTSWHPGWRWHLTFGNIIALTLTEMLEDALKYLMEREAYTVPELLSQLRAEEVEEFQNFTNSDILTPGKTDIVSEDQLNGLDMRTLLRSKPICRTCRLPAMARYLGLMTETTPGDMFHYPMGSSYEEATSQANEQSMMRLVWEAKDRQQCEVPLNQDFKDYYMVTAQDGWQSLIIPNDREADYYKASDPYKGIVMVTMPICDWGNCPAGAIREDGYASGSLEMTVNGVKVTNATVAWGSHFLRHGDGEVIFPPNDQGRFEIKVRVNGDTTANHARFSTFTIW
ncbi:hypothetical protein MPSEU_001054500 [Mayamaea pseudoterrestris]|nr:hypothetical protein MPSEU_001054500 [Mayamaea pseudoterrestris]